MEGAIVGGATQGKLYCPGCGARLGSFNWAGITNTCGAWITPGFQLHLSRLDELRPRGAAGGGGGAAAALPGLRLPALLAERRQQAAAEAGDLLSDLSLNAAAPDGAGAPQGAAGAPPDSADGSAAAAGRPDRLGDSPPPGAPQAPASLEARTASYFQHLVLDCDGVLVDTERASCEALRLAVLEVTGLQVPGSFPKVLVDAPHAIACGAMRTILLVFPLAHPSLDP
ncbi:hypothetical protein MNEG_16139 [Monoraphidium neglectum]|uniref:protein-tyrosine-phosphatase n=1 Tax=Monoraphidium neglectum TaxID=145388 RepID=A0A0D2LIH7_9CHLO|nr:hypothetical protein MNEG_16139 [Monoraphidium neglectum]KIY91824.1 hypothetical protein MNEG_16139 [Monoraphidium neglectum]|eukprot:XP_013890844.1 hypothetical protein MNEG_16139 [Monoraphidium neglectum]